MTKDQAMRLALEALVCLKKDFDADQFEWEIADEAITALQKALAHPEQEPVAWGVFDGPNLHDMFFTEEEAQDMARLKGDGSVVKPLRGSNAP